MRFQSYSALPLRRSVLAKALLADGRLDPPLLIANWLLPLPRSLRLISPMLRLAPDELVSDVERIPSPTPQVRASMTIVGLLPPVCEDGCLLVDGGCVRGGGKAAWHWPGGVARG